jgi:hypothetical protein
MVNKRAGGPPFTSRDKRPTLLDLQTGRKHLPWTCPRAITVVGSHGHPAWSGRVEELPWFALQIRGRSPGPERAWTAAAEDPHTPRTRARGSMPQNYPNAMRRVAVVRQAQGVTYHFLVHAAAPVLALMSGVDTSCTTHTSPCRYVVCDRYVVSVSRCHVMRAPPAALECEPAIHHGFLRRFSTGTSRMSITAAVIGVRFTKALNGACKIVSIAPGVHIDVTPSWAPVAASIDGFVRS